MSGITQAGDSASGSGSEPSPARIDLGRLLSPPARDLVDAAAARTAERGEADLDTQHLLWAATRQPATRTLLCRAGADPDEIARKVEALTSPQSAAAGTTPTREGAPQLSPASKRALLDSHRISGARGSSFVGAEHLLLALAANDESGAGRLLRAALATPESLQRALGADDESAAGGSPTPTVDEYGQDLSELARFGKLDPLVGRMAEVEQVLEVLTRRTRNNPVLIGEVGVGKTAIVEGIAQRIVEGDVPDTLAGRRVVQLDLIELTGADTQEKMAAVIGEIREHGEQLVVFVNGLHTAFAASADGGTAVGTLLRSALVCGELHIISATTLEEYHRHIERNPVLEGRFVPVLVSEPSVPETVAILRGLRDRYEAHHQVRLTDAALTAAATLSARYLTDRRLPEKAIGLVDQAGARARLRARTPSAQVRGLEQQLEQLLQEKKDAIRAEQFELSSLLRDHIADAREFIAAARADLPTGPPDVGAAEIAEMVSRTTGVPMTQLTEVERDRLSKLESELARRVIGQAEAAAAVAEAVRRSRAGLSDPARPIGSFLFVGPSGVGKTELARALAQSLFGDDSRMVALDMTAHSEQTATARLIGKPATHMGPGEVGLLTDAVRRHPYSVVLLEDVDKAHNDVHSKLAQVLDAGRMVDGHGRTVDFRNTVVIMTTGVGADAITPSSRLGFGSGQHEGETELQNQLAGRLRKVFPSEFLNRIDDVVVLRHLEDAHLRSITRLLLEETRARLRDQDITLDVEESAVQWLVQCAHRPESGARPLRRTVAREFDNRVSALLIDERLEPRTHLVVSTDGERLTFDIADPAMTT